MIGVANGFYSCNYHFCLFTVKVPDSDHVDERVYTHSHMVIGRAGRYEYAGRQHESTNAGSDCGSAVCTKQSTFITMVPPKAVCRVYCKSDGGGL
ncbi:MAG: hypothetical protein HFG34_06525 [Eubacterium sp.]|nr:hypothetical protein [Eubacterium sp.]